MKLDQTITLIYTVVGVLSGFISSYFHNLLLAVVIPLIIYVISLVPLLNSVKQKKKFWLFYNSFITFALVWMMVWILIFNL